jgi:hypothetical protein
MKAAPPTARLGLVLRAAVWLAASALLTAPDRAAAEVRQPTGELMPQPVRSEELGIPTSRGFQPLGGFSVVTLEALFLAQGEMLNPQRDAQTTPGTFSPLCGFKGQLVLRGGRCHLALGWYNVVEGSTTPPAANQIYPLVPATFLTCPAMPPMPDPTITCYDDNDFSPLATYNSNQFPQHRWSNPPFDANIIAGDPRYRQGAIGFALLGAEDCSQNKYSQAELNTRNAAGVPWVTTLIYQSTVDPNAYYVAFEDRPNSMASWRGPDPQSTNNDGDFNDFVYKITGVTCQGGGKLCDTMMPGICKEGTTQCASGGTVIRCTPNTAPKTETCDGLDNDCNGAIDDGSPCEAPRICDRGKCILPCSDSELPCLGGLVCSEGYCKDPSCIGITCPEQQICVGGTCRGGCGSEVHCPPGQTCRIGRCVDPCSGVTCDNNWVCESGACVPQCGPCRSCNTGQTCGTAMPRKCLDNGCDRQTCDPPRTVCVAGSCQDGCQDVRCPGGQECWAGECQDVATPGGGTGGVGVLIDAGSGPPGRDGGTGGRAGSTTVDAGPDARAGGGSGAVETVQTCGCDAGAGRGEGAIVALALLASVWGCRRGGRRRSGTASRA